MRPVLRGEAGRRRALSCESGSDATRSCARVGSPTRSGPGSSKVGFGLESGRDSARRRGRHAVASLETLNTYRQDIRARLRGYADRRRGARRCDGRRRFCAACAPYRRGGSRPTVTCRPRRHALRALSSPRRTRTCPGSASCGPTARLRRASVSDGCSWPRACRSAASGSTCARRGSRSARLDDEHVAGGLVRHRVRHAPEHPPRSVHSDAPDHDEFGVSLLGDRQNRIRR